MVVIGLQQTPVVDLYQKLGDKLNFLQSKCDFFLILVQ